MVDILDRGNTLIIFPEGGIGPGDGHVRPLQSGTAYLAQRTGYPILTVGITGSYDLWWRKRLTVRIGPCIDPARVVEGTARAIPRHDFRYTCGVYWWPTQPQCTLSFVDVLSC
jgi:1-acyl-sn-glycerol-3-phosphate acyltransferase